MSTSTTYNEQDELLKYEYTLASCYEAEYLLSLKLQENMMHAGKSEYYDGFEVQEYYPTSATDSCGRSQVCNGAEAVVDAHSSVPATSEECMETDYGSPCINNHPLRTLPDFTVLSTANGWLPTEQCSSPPPLVTHHDQQLLASSMDTNLEAPEPGAAVQQNEYAQDHSHNLHNDGPSRKRICLHH